MVYYISASISNISIPKMLNLVSKNLENVLGA